MESAERPSDKPRAPQERERQTVLTMMKEEGIAVEESNQDTFSNVINVEGFEGLSLRGKKCLVSLAEESKRFWTGLIIRDNFEKDHEGRQTFQDKMSGFPAYKELDNRNKLRTNMHTNLYTGFRLLVKELDEAKIATPQADKVREIYASLFPIESIGKSGEAAANAHEKFPAMAPIDFYATPYDEEGHVSDREPSYVSYYLDLTEEQRFEILSNFDKAAHDFLELVTAPLEKKLNL